MPMKTGEVSRTPVHMGEPTVPPIVSSSPPVFSPAASPDAYRVLAAVSIDRTADWALLEAIRLCRSDGELHVVHALTPTDYGHADDRVLDVDKRMARAMRLIEMRLDRLLASSEPQRVEAHLRLGEPVATVLQAAHDIDADLIVVGTHRRAGLRRFLQGSVAERILRESHCPVLVAFPRTSPAGARSERIAPPCPACVELQTRTDDPTRWCEQHSSSRASRVILRREERGGRQSILRTY